MSKKGIKSMMNILILSDGEMRMLNLFFNLTQKLPYFQEWLSQNKMQSDDYQSLSQKHAEVYHKNGLCVDPECAYDYEK